MMLVSAVVKPSCARQRVLRRLLPAWAGCLLLLVAGCGAPIERLSGRDGDEPAVPYPTVERDLDQLRRGGVLRMITHYNSSSYFIHKGGQAGFDFELLQRFAKAQGLTVEVVIPEAGEDAISLLNAGRGDVVCTGRRPDDRLARWVTWTRPTNFVQKTLVLRDDDRRVADENGLEGLTIILPDGDPFRRDLQELRASRGLRFRIGAGRPHAGPEELVAMVSRGELQATIVDDVVARAALSYLPDLKLGLKLGDQRPTVWLVRQNNPELKAALNRYLKDHLSVSESGRRRRSQTYGIIYDRYFENPKTIRGFREPAHRPDKSGRISRYDDLVREQAEAAGLDWRLVAALIYQESRFYPFARSKANARGLMQVLPQFAGPERDSLYVPAANVRAGLRLMRRTWRSYAYLDSLDRMRFTLAEYHAGAGHLTDARRIAMDMGRDPNRWERSLKETLPLLTQERHFSRTRHGFYKGNKTVAYVEEIVSRYQTYQRLVPRYPEAVADSLELDLPGNEAELLQALPEMVIDRPPPE